MINSIIVDSRDLFDNLSLLRDFLNEQSISNNRKVHIRLLPVILAGIDDTRFNTNLWCFLEQNMPPERFNKVDYETVSYVFENMSEFIYDRLNKLFNMVDGTIYEFQCWIGDDIMLSIYKD